MKYFSNILTIDELKKHRRKLAIENHPDKGGSTEIMQEINAEYDRVMNMLKDPEPGSYSDNSFGYNFPGGYDFRYQKERAERPAYRQNVKARRGGKMDPRDFVNRDDD